MQWEVEGQSVPRSTLLCIPLCYHSDLEAHGLVDLVLIADVHFLTIARGSNAEIETQLLICVRLNYLTKEQTKQAINLCSEISRVSIYFSA